MKCFVISPIGEETSDVRKHADEVFKYIIAPALEHFGIVPVRSDQLAEPGKISDQMYRAIFEYDLCIAVLTYANPNVYYELAVAQSHSRPVVIMIAKGSSLPFDVKDFRSLTYDLEISSYEAKTHINRLISMLNELKRAQWRGDDIFQAYRSQYARAGHTDVKSYGIRITSPTGADPVDVVDVNGTFQLIPPGYELRTLRYYPRTNGFIPHGAVATDGLEKTWRVSGFDVGGQSGEERGIVIVLAGSGAKMLLDYWVQAHTALSEVQKALREATGKYGRWLPEITTWPEDLIQCRFSTYSPKTTTSSRLPPHRRWGQLVELGARKARPYPASDAFAIHYNRRHMRLESDAGALRPV
jgi:hypothetical protein